MVYRENNVKCFVEVWSKTEFINYMKYKALFLNSDSEN